jgi:hypothetical protein
LTDTIKHYLADGGADYVKSPHYEKCRIELADKLAAGPVSFAEMARTLGMPLPVIVEIYNTWRTERAAANSVKH